MISLNLNAIRRGTFALVFCGLISSLALPFTGASYAAGLAGSRGAQVPQAAATPAAASSLTPEQAR